MALPMIVEGTWEEISAHADQFKDHKLQLIVLPDKIAYDVDEAEQERLRATGLRVFEEADNTPREPAKNKHIVDEAEQDRLRKTMMELLEDVGSIEREPGRSLTDPYEAEFGRILEEKYRKMGFIV